ncbi:hypothetical protein ACS0TY_013435 [Phlomoides rotata]
MAAGHPPRITQLSVSTQQIVYLKVVNLLLLVVAPTHLELWSSSQHRVRLGKYKRNADSIQREGENLQAIWSPDTKLIAILVNVELLSPHFKVQMTEKKIHVGGKQPTGLFLANISLLLSEQVPFANKNLSVSNFVCDNKHMLIGLSDGSLYIISWKGEFGGAFSLDMRLKDSTGANKLSNHFGNGLTTRGIQGHDGSNHMNHVVSQNTEVVHLEFSIAFWLLFVLYSDGELIQCSVSKRGLKYTESIIVERRLGSGEVVCTSIAPQQQILAVGTHKGAAELYDLADSASLIRSVALHD